jgi:uncharacterized protein YggE
VTVRINAVARAGEIISASLQALGDGAELEGLRFGREDRSEAEAEARRKAWTAVERKASDLAGLFGVTVGKPVAIVESSGAVGDRIPDFGLGAKVDVATAAAPIEQGSTEVAITLTVRYATG